jgi:predicted MPP superfamily phosphohydrolase
LFFQDDVLLFQVFDLFKLALCLYVIVRTIMPLPTSRLVKIIVAVALVVISQHHLITRITTGNMFSPEVPRAVMISVNIGFVFIVLAAMMQLLSDIISVLIALVKRRQVRVSLTARAIIIALSLGLSSYGVSQALRVPSLKEVTLEIKGLPQQFDGYRLVQLTDLHLSRLFQREWAEATVTATNAIGADLIVITGDLIDGTIEARKNDVPPLGDLRAPDGVLVIPGNHEYYFGRPEWMAQFKALGMQVLENQHTLIERDGASLTLAGVTDRSAVPFGQEGPDLQKALAGSPPDNVVVLLDHQPRMAQNAADLGVDVQLSGHTHGGMIWGFDRIVAMFNNGFVSGRYQVGDMQLYVNNGTALWIGFAVRLGVPSELTVITFKSV